MVKLINQILKAVKRIFLSTSLPFYLFTCLCLPFYLSTCLYSAFDELGISARTKGLGETFVAIADTPESIYYNPAGLAKLEKPSLTATYYDLYTLGLINYSFLGYVQPNIGQGVIGVGWLRLATTKNVSFLKYSEDTLIFSYSRIIKVYKKFKPSVGLSVKYYNAEYSDGRGSGYGLDSGAGYQYKKFLFGLMLKDLNRPSIVWDTGAKDYLEPDLRFGAGYQITKNLIFTSDVTDLLNEQRYHFATECWNKKKTFGLRCGTELLYEGKYNFSCGVSIGMKSFRFDYGFEFHPDLENNHIFSLNVFW